MHEMSLIPGRSLAISGNGAFRDPAYCMPFYQLAYPDRTSELTLSAIAAAKEYSKRKFWSKWIKKVLPWADIERNEREIDLPETIALEGEGIVVFCPEIKDDWLYSPLVVFNVPEGDTGKKVTLYSLDERCPIVTITLHEDGTGYYTDERFQIATAVNNG
jgi:hypothetical protein